jgi:hypothetical protein
MLGFLFGTVCLIGLIKLLRHGRGFHHGAFGCGHHYGYGRPSRASRWFLRSLFERLDTTPGQEKAIAAALEQLRENRRIVGEELEQTRGDLARAVSGGIIDDRTLDETFARHDRLLAQLRVSFVEALKAVTEALDERQRKLAAEWLDRRSWRGPQWGGPYRDGGIWA